MVRAEALQSALLALPQLLLRLPEVDRSLTGANAVERAGPAQPAAPLLTLANALTLVSLIVAAFGVNRTLIVIADYCQCL